MSDLHAYLIGQGRDAQGRRIDDVLGMPDADLELHHDYIQWLFPLPTASAAVPGSPVLSAVEIETIRSDPQARDALQRAARRMISFYSANDHWLVPYDHNHLRITRIIQSLRLLVDQDAAETFHAIVSARNERAGSPVNARSLRYWREALG